MVCMFTGHRPSTLPFGYRESDGRCQMLKVVLRHLIEEQIEAGVDTFITGMAQGTDTYAAEAVLTLKQAYPTVRLIAVLPCRGQTARWPRGAVERYERILKACDEVILLQEDYTADCMQRRNRHMVSLADACIAVWNRRPSGTGGTVRLAREKGIPVTVLDPISFEVERPRE